jgi:hypothetical protein
LPVPDYAGRRGSCLFILAEKPQEVVAAQHLLGSEPIVPLPVNLGMRRVSGEFDRKLRSTPTYFSCADAERIAMQFRLPCPHARLKYWES